jgi:tetratricopeptide (TPR) repeat protein
MMEIGRVRWLSSMPDGEATLPGALEMLDAAKGALADDDPVELRAAVATSIAAVWYDGGDAASLERALGELTEASRLLLEAGHATAAARLLNDQAAVYVRMGDPVRATHLLGESRRIFEPRASRDPVAMLEMAETDHLFARIPLHVPARPGREADALTMGLDHALAAQRVYERLDVRRELGRVWETMGRLELRKGRLDRARTHLVEAVKMEEALGDLVGLARSTAALSELLAASGHHQEAVDVLGDSIALNVEKGSPIGLAFNRRALAALARSDAARGGAAEGLRGLERRLADAERVLGRLRLPGEPDPMA